MTDSTSVTLLQRLRDPADELAWGRFVEIYTPVLYRWARRAGLSDQDAGDLLQDLFILLLRKLPEFQYDRSKGRFRGWLQTVTLNKLRERMRRRQEILVGSDAHRLEQVDEEAASAFWEAEYRDHLIAHALLIMQRDFEPNTWKACWETAYVGRPTDEVGDELGMSAAAVYAARSRVLRRVREEIGEMLE